MEYHLISRVVDGRQVVNLYTENARNLFGLSSLKKYHLKHGAVETIAKEVGYDPRGYELSGLYLEENIKIRALPADDFDRELIQMFDDIVARNDLAS